MNFCYPQGATPLDQDEVDGLIPTHIHTQPQLNEWEQNNIAEAYQWLMHKPPKLETILTIEFIKTLHKKMLGKTWRWAGKFRKSNKNIGVDWEIIYPSLVLLLDDILYQQKHGVYSPDEIATHLHHRLVATHPFSNGNGRHARLFTDTFLAALKIQNFSWGKLNLTAPSKTREKYIKALRKADKHDYTDLIQFVRS